MSLESKTKKELVEIIRQMKSKLLDLQELEKEKETELDSLKGLALSVAFDENKGYYLVELNYSLDKNKAVIKKSENKEFTKDLGLTIFKAKKFLVEKIINEEQTRSLIKGEKK